MLKVLGVKDLDELIDETIPKSIRQDEPLDFGKPKSERELLVVHARRSPRRTRS